MRIRDLTIDPPIVLAPMSGITDIAFRTLCREMGAALAYTGLISANALRYRSAKTRTLLDFPPHDHPIAAQVFGADPDVVAAAADIAVGAGADMVDINMGCSVPKVLRANAGAALMADLKHAGRDGEGCRVGGRGDAGGGEAQERAARIVPGRG